MPECERYVAIDNICAWPQLTRLPDGRIGVIAFNQPNHGRTEGEVQCWLNEDGQGRLWTPAGIPVPHAPGANRMNQASGLAGNGDYLVIVSGYDNRPPVGQEDANTGPSQILDPVVARSSDSGKTWRSVAVIPKTEDGRHLIPFGPIIKRADEQLLACFYAYKPSPPPENPEAKAANAKMDCNAVVYRSGDDGATWQHHATIAHQDYNECVLHAVDDQRYLAVARTYTDQTLHLFVSDDAGDTWRFHCQVTGAYEHNGHLLNLPDGRVLLTYGIRHPNRLALACRVSPDKGLTWRRPHALLTIDETERYDGGYPSCVLVGQDRILTAYYTRRSHHHHRYHMGVLLWNWQEEFKHGFDK